jgi:hypothetical protein
MGNTQIITILNGLAFRIVMIWVLEGRLAKVLPLLVYQTRGSCLRILSLMDGFEGGVCGFRGGIWNFEKVVWRAGREKKSYKSD